MYVDYFTISNSISNNLKTAYRTKKHVQNLQLLCCVFITDHPVEYLISEMQIFLVTTLVEDIELNFVREI